MYVHTPDKLNDPVPVISESENGVLAITIRIVIANKVSHCSAACYIAILLYFTASEAESVLDREIKRQVMRHYRDFRLSHTEYESESL